MPASPSGKTGARVSPGYYSAWPSPALSSVTTDVIGDLPLKAGLLVFVCGWRHVVLTGRPHD